MKASTVLTAVVAASATAALSLAAAGAAVAAPVAHSKPGHPVTRVTGHVLATALLPESDFGADYYMNAYVYSTGEATLATVAGTSCAVFEQGYLVGYGDTAEANMTSALIPTAVPAAIAPPSSVSQDVAQFPSRRAAQSFFSQAQAKYRRCVSFPGLPYDLGLTRIVLTGRGVTRTTVRGYPAFQTDQELQPAVLSGGYPVAYLNTVVGLAGTTVYLIQQQENRDTPVPAWMPTDLISRIQALYR